MISKKFGRRQKGKNNTGRAVKVTSIMISQALKDRLSELKDAYECCYNETVTYDQLLTRWADNVGRIDPKVPGHLATLREERAKYRERMAEGLGLTAEQLEDNIRSFNPAEPENTPWDLMYFFEKDGEQVEALPGDRAPFYARLDGRNVGLKEMLAGDWSLMNEVGVELDYAKAVEVARVIREHTAAEPGQHQE